MSIFWFQRSGQLHEVTGDVSATCRMEKIRLTSGITLLQAIFCAEIMFDNWMNRACKLHQIKTELTFDRECIFGGVYAPCIYSHARRELL